MTRSAPLRVGLIGAGRMGGHHARQLRTLETARLVGIHDTHPERAQALATQHGCAPFASIDDVLASCDAAVVATSSTTHVAVGRRLLDAGIACLIEKPLATTEADCLDLIAAAARSRVVLAVGHVERFNPATVALLETIRGWTVRAIETHRVNPDSARIADTSVVSDLMVHDLDIVLHIMGQVPTDNVGRGIVRNAATGADHATALLSFGDGALAACTASRITAHRARELVVMSDRGTVTVDYLTRSVALLEPGATQATAVAVGQADALATELGGFVESVRAGGSREGRHVSGAEALAALRVAWAIERQITLR